MVSVTKVESEYDTGWREGYEAASGAAIDLRTENERLNDWAHKMEEEARQATFEVERLRAAMEEIANVAHPTDMRATNIARKALGRA